MVSLQRLNTSPKPAKAAKGKEKAEKLSALREYGIVTAAILAAEEGRVLTAANFRASIAKGKPLPDPRASIAEELDAA
jgi:phage tail tape-measure protein